MPADLHSLTLGSRVLIRDTITNQEYPGIVQQLLGTTVFIQEEQTGIESASTSQWAFNIETGKHISFLYESSLIVLPQ